MSIPERARALWAEWAPDYREGRLDVGRVVIVFTTRKRLQRQAWEHLRMGAEMESERPGAAAEVAKMVAELNGEEPVATAHRLHAV